MKKRILSCLVLAATLLSLASCAKPAAPQQDSTPQLNSTPQLDPDNPVSLEIWHYYNGPQKTSFDAILNEFNETVGMERGIIVEGFSHGNVTELATSVLDAAAKKVGASEVPDIFAAYADTAYAVDQLGLLADLTPYLSQETLSAYRPEFIEEGDLSGDGALKIFPIAKSVELMFLNQTDWDKFAQATGAQLEQLDTMEGVTATAKAYYEWTDSLTDLPNDGKAFFGRDSMANYFVIGCRQLGVEIFQAEHGRGTINPDEQAIRRLWDNYYVPFIHGWFSASGRFRSDAAHMGDIIAFVGSSSGATYFPDEVAISDFESYPIDCLVRPAPILEGGESFAVQQGAGMAVTKSDPVTEYAATVFLTWFTQPEHNADFAAGSGYLPVTRQALTLPVLEEAVAKGTDPEQLPRMQQTFAAAMEQLEHCTFYTTRAFQGGNDARNILETSMSELAQADRQAILELVDGGMPAQEAIAQYNTDEHFQQWYAQFTQDLTNTLP